LFYKITSYSSNIITESNLETPPILRQIFERFGINLENAKELDTALKQLDDLQLPNFIELLRPDAGQEILRDCFPIVLDEMRSRITHLDFPRNGESSRNDNDTNP